jgi:Flp pilus assembly protein TadD
MKWGHVFENFLIFFLILGFLSCANKEEQAEKHFRLGFSHQDQGNLDQAIEEYEKAVELNPSHLKARMNLGAAYMRQEKYDQAIEEFSTVVKLNYYHANAHYNLGYIYSLKGEKEKAQEELKVLKMIGSGLAERLEERIKKE